MRPEENCGPTSHGLERIEAWLSDDDWDVIHFNFGLHDMKYVDDQGERVSTDTGKVQVPLPQYEQNLRKIVTRLRETGAKLIWCTTTPVPPGPAGRAADDAVRYNGAEGKVLRVAFGEDRVSKELQ